MTMVSVQFPNKNSKVNYYGIEVDPDITWDTWEPGKKYTKKLLLKNCKFVTQKLNFCVPAKEVFTTTFPKTITLSAGTSFCLPITFKPHKKDVFIDKIDFKNTDGEIFSVPVRALLPKFAVEFQSKISCGTVAAHDVGDVKIVVKNMSELETPFKWNFDAPYSIEPANGSLQPYGSIEFTVTFKPQDVGTYTMSIPFLYGSKMSHQKILVVSSVAKYPNISLMVDDLNQVEALNEDGQIVVDFGEGSVGKIYEKVITVQNLSEVNASVEVERIDATNEIDWVFYSSIVSSKVPGRSLIYIVMRFRPKLVLTHYAENFIIRISNKCGTYLLKCIAKTDGPIIESTHTSINFFQLKPTESLTQAFYLNNRSSSTHVPFEFVIDSNNSVFRVDPVSGTVKPNDRVQIVVEFRPQAPIQYYRRLVCLIPDQEPIFVDLLGTCHDLNNRPHILQLKHLLKFQKRQKNGLSYQPPENLMRYLTKNQLCLTENGDLLIEKEDEMATENLERVPDMSRWKEYFFTHSDQEYVLFTPYIGQDKSIINFTRCNYMDKNEIQNQLLRGTMTDNANIEQINQFRQTLVLKNNTKGSVIIQWSDIRKKNPSYGIFQIEPMNTELSIDETREFTVTFSPDGSDKIFGIEFEAFAYFKSQRQFELVDENLISPSFCVVVKCLGHTFKSNHEPFQPAFNFDKSEVVFPSVNTSEMAFSSLTFTNKSDKPIIYDCQKLNQPFAINPSSGYVYPKQKQIFTILCEPKAIETFQGLIAMKLNNRQDYIERIPILGSADNALIQMSNRSEMFFGMTNIGNISIQRYSIKNTSRIPLKYTWKIRPDDSFIVRVYPSEGMLQPNEALTQQWIFNPSKCGRTVLKTLLTVQGLSPFGTLTEPKYFPLRIIGNGEYGMMESELPRDPDANSNTDESPQIIEFPDLVVGSSAQQTFTIHNPSDATIYYRLLTTQLKQVDSGDAMTCDSEPDCVEIKEKEGVLAGRTMKTISVSVRPRQRAHYRFNIGYVLLDNDQLELMLQQDTDYQNDVKSMCSKRRVLTSEQYLLSLKVQGVFPTMRITDIQGTGSCLWTSKVNLWRNFSIDNLNVIFDSDPTTSELIHNVATRASFHRNTPVSTRALIYANIGAAPLNSDVSEVRLLFENCGTVSSQFVFLLPDDLELDLEYWAETGEYTDEELHQMKVQDNNLFSIEPKSAFIKPGDNVTVVIRYNHLVVGTDRLPVLFKLDQGREILLNLVGVTLDPQRSYIHFPSNTHVFGPIPIGLSKSPIQYYELQNAGAVPVHFELDLSPIEELTRENYGISVLQCLNPVGDILPGQTCRLEWIFSPVEAKTYKVDVPIHLSSGECPIVTFTAVAYDQRELGYSMSPELFTGESPQQASTGGGHLGQSGVPSVQSIELPGQLATLNFERVDIGVVPTFCSVRRVVFLNNVTGNRSITFSWNVTNSEDAEYVFISPQNGRLLPKESCTCHVIIQTRNVPRFFEINLICEIYAEDDIIKFRQDLLSWEQEEARREVEFTITDSKKQPNKSILSNLNDPFPTRIKSPNLSFLPPVLKSPPKSRLFSNPKSSGTVTMSVGSDQLKSRKENGGGNLWYKPKMPKPFFLNFGVSGRACPIDEFQKDAANRNKTYCLNKLTMMENLNSPSILNKPLENDSMEALCPVKSHQKEGYIVEMGLIDLIGSIMDDQEFKDALEGINKEPIPYYLQFPNVKAVSNDDHNNVCHEKEGIPEADEEEEEDEEDNDNTLQEQESTTENMDQKSPTTNNDNQIDDNSEIENITREVSGELEKKEKLIKESLPFGTILEGILENMLVNIVAEANNREIDLTARPRLIALPPRSAGATNTHTNT